MHLVTVYRDRTKHLTHATLSRIPSVGDLELASSESQFLPSRPEVGESCLTRTKANEVEREKQRASIASLPGDGPFPGSSPSYS